MLSRFFIERPIFAWVIALVIMLAGAIAIFLRFAEERASGASTVPCDA